MEDEKSCLICAEDFSFKKPAKILKCCSKVLCQDCLYSHIKSILEEGITGDGRKELACPFGCGSTICDSQVREAFRMKHFDIFRYICGMSLYKLVSIFGILDGASWCWDFAKSAGEKLDLQHYYRWSLGVALSSPVESDRKPVETHSSEKGLCSEATYNEMDANHIYTKVIYCPQPDCECLWLVNSLYYKKKMGNERSHYNRKKHDEAPTGMKNKFMLSYNSLFYKPIKAEKEEKIMNKNGYTTEHWLNPIDIDMFDEKHVSKMKQRIDLQSSRSDGRLVTCPSCRYQFCGLCSRPWTTISKYSGIRVCHEGQLCAKYGCKASGDVEFLAAAEAGDARCCPGCSLRTNRIDGCNHMTCICGCHWCYVCECRFDPRHYGCSDQNKIGSSFIGNGSSCIIS